MVARRCKTTWLRLSSRSGYERQDHLGDTRWVPMDCPATSERIQQLCGVSAQSLTR